MKQSIIIVLFITAVAMISAGVSKFPGNQENALSKNIQPTEAQSFTQTNYIPEPQFDGPDFTKSAEKSVNAVVHIRSEFSYRTSGYNDFFGQFREFLGEPSESRRTYSGFGSGTIIAPDGYIVTNNHVVDGAEKIEVILNDKRKFPAELIGSDPSTDLALIKINEDQLSYLVYGNSDEVKIGEWVIAVGNPFNLTSTVTAGIVSAKARGLNILGTPGAIESFIQTDAAVNRGNSGGALVNSAGELIGINAAIASQTGVYTGYSFAIPVNIVKKVMDDFLNYGQVQRAYIGVVIQEVNAELAEEEGLDEIRGIYIARLSEDGGAMGAGIEEGDVIVGIDGTEVNSTAQLLEIIAQHSPGDQVSVDVLRDGSERDYLVELKNERGTVALATSTDNFFMPDLGANFKPVSPDEKSRMDLDYGLKVESLRDGLLMNGGVKEGFIIQEINGVKIRAKEDIDLAIKDIRGGVMRISGVYPNGMRMNYGFVL